MRRLKEIQANPNIDFSKMNVERFYETLVKILEDKEGVKLEYTVRKKTPEEYAADPNKMVEVSDRVRMQIWGQ